MGKMLILAAVAAVSLACANRSEEEVGAAPDQGDTTAVTHVIDSTRTGPPGVGGRPGNATVTADSVGADSALTNQETTDSASTYTSTPQDTLGPQDTSAQDTSMTQQDTTMMHGDSAMTDHAVPDTTAGQ